MTDPLAQHTNRSSPVAVAMAKYNALPRSGRWLVWLGAFLGVYFAAIDPVLARRAALASEASRIEAALSAKAQARTRVAESERVVAQGAGFFGRPALPAASVDNSALFEARINQVFAANKVSPRITYRDPVLFTGDTPKVLGGGQKLERLVVELSFETDVITLVNILKDLEHAKEIAAVSKIGLRKQAAPSRRPGDAGPLLVNLTAEAWALASTSAVGGAR